VSTEKATRVLGFHPRHDVLSIVDELFAHLPEIGDWDDPRYYNIEVFKTLDLTSDRAPVG
jgi:hypothetical protein